MPRSLFGVGGHCPACGLEFELAAGDFSGAIMIAQMLLGLMAIPVWLFLTAVTPLGFEAKVVWTMLILVSLLLVFYRNVKGMWYGFLTQSDALQRRPRT